MFKASLSVKFLLCVQYSHLLLIRIKTDIHYKDFAITITLKWRLKRIFLLWQPFSMSFYDLLPFHTSLCKKQYHKELGKLQFAQLILNIREVVPNLNFSSCFLYSSAEMPLKAWARKISLPAWSCISSFQIFYIFLLWRWQIELNIYPTLFCPLYPIYLKSCHGVILITWIALKFQWTGLQVAHAWLLLALMQLCAYGITIVGVRKIKHELHFVMHGYFLFYNQTCNYSVLVIVLTLVRSISSLL